MPLPFSSRIVGCGVLSGAGRGRDNFWRALQNASPGQAPADLGDAALAATYVAIPTARDSGDDDLAAHWLQLACNDALADAAPQFLRCQPHPRMALMAGTSLGGMSSVEHQQRAQWDATAKRGPGVPCPPLPWWRGLYDGPATHVGANLDVTSGAWTVNTACSSAANALGLARRWLRHDRADVILVAGFDVVSPFVYAGFAALGAIDAAPSTPFGAQRRGLNLGEAAVAFVLMRGDDVPADACSIDIVGYGSSCDAYHLTRPDPEGRGLARAMRAALTDAALEPGDIDVISAHATGTSLNDAMEDAAFKSIFGAHRPLVHAAKPVVGHTLGAAGAIDVLAMMLSLQHGIVPRTYQRGATDPALCFHPSDEARAITREATILSTSSGFGGSNAALVLKMASV